MIYKDYFLVWTCHREFLLRTLHASFNTVLENSPCISGVSYTIMHKTMESSFKCVRTRCVVAFIFWYNSMILQSCRFGKYVLQLDIFHVHSVPVSLITAMQSIHLSWVLTCIIGRLGFILHYLSFYEALSWRLQVVKAILTSAVAEIYHYVDVKGG